MDGKEAKRNGLGTAVWRGWFRRLQPLLAVLAIVAASSVRAHAVVDVCMDYSGGGGLVFKRFKAPGKNKCAPLQGFQNALYGAGVATTACTASTGKVMILHYTSHNWGNSTKYFETATCRVILPITPTGNFESCSGTYLSTPGGPGGFAQYALFRTCNVDIPE